jgi:hypothetical protein
MRVEIDLLPPSGFNSIDEQLLTMDELNDLYYRQWKV